MSSRSETARIAPSETQPSCCYFPRHRIAITADAWQPRGYLAISFFTNARFSSENAKLAGCNSFGARRRTDIVQSLIARGAAAFALSALIRSSQNALAVPNTL